MVIVVKSALPVPNLKSEFNHMKTTHTVLHRILNILTLGICLFISLILFTTSAQAQCGAMDVAFVVDDTGSLGGALNSIKSELTQILDDVDKASRGDYRLALVTFKDDVTVRETFAAQNRTSIAAKIQELSAFAGGQLPEASDEALNTVINALPKAGRQQNIDFSTTFRPSAYKVIILITDAVPGGFDNEFIPGVTDVRAHNFALQAVAKGIKVSAIYVPTFPNDTAQIKPVMQDYATTTSGFYLETMQDGTGTATAIRTIITGCGSTSTVPVATAIIPSDDKLGSFLFYPLYASDAANAGQENTLMTLTNRSEEKSVNIHIFFVEGDTGKAQDFYVCLLPTRHTNFLASEYDPGVKGYVLAIAVDKNGTPINFNFLMGSSAVKLKTGHQAILNAISFSSLRDDPATINTDDQLATLNFDGLNYDLAPRVLGIDNFPSPADGNAMLLVVNRFGGNLADVNTDGTPHNGSAGTIGALTAVFYDDSERSQAFNVSLVGNTAQQRNVLRDGYPRMLPLFSKVITQGHSGWMRFNSIEGNSIVGAAINYNPKTLQNNGHNLHQIALTDKASFTIPIISSPMACN